MVITYTEAVALSVEKAQAEWLLFLIEDQKGQTRLKMDQSGLAFSESKGSIDSDPFGLIEEDQSRSIGSIDSDPFVFCGVV